MPKNNFLLSLFLVVATNCGTHKSDKETQDETKYKPAVYHNTEVEQKINTLKSALKEVLVAAQIEKENMAK